MPEPVLEPWLAKLASALPAAVQERLTNVEAQLTVHAVALAALAQRDTTQEEAMASVQDYVTRVDSATSEIAGDLQELKAQLESVRDEIPAAQQAAVDEALAQLDGPITRLEALGREDDAPVDETPVDETPAPPADEPAPGDEV